METVKPLFESFQKRVDVAVEFLNREEEELEEDISEEDYDLQNVRMNAIAKAIARKIVRGYRLSPDLQNLARRANEPYRTIAWEYGLKSIDGTELWHAIMDEMDGKL